MSGADHAFQDPMGRWIPELRAVPRPRQNARDGSCRGAHSPGKPARARQSAELEIAPEQEAFRLRDAAQCRGFSSQSWLTFRQALGLGGNVRKGERGKTVVYADRFTPEDERRRAEQTGEEPGAIPFLKRFTVFNTDQCEGLPEEIAKVAPPPPPGLIEPQAEALIAATGADFRIGGARAFYSPTHDFIQVPPPQAYFEPINWHRTACHELAHWVGHPSRLARDLSGSYGSKAYAREELIAEMAGAFVCASLGIAPTVRHADYIGSWLEVLREDDRAIVRAASAASKAADYLLAFQPDRVEPVDANVTTSEVEAA